MTSLLGRLRDLGPDDELLEPLRRDAAEDVVVVDAVDVVAALRHELLDVPPVVLEEAEVVGNEVVVPAAGALDDDDAVVVRLLRKLLRTLMRLQLQRAS